MKSRLIVLLIFCLCPLAQIRADSIRPAFRNLGPGEGFTQTNILSICQDASGALWTAGRNGVAKYSGVLPEDTSPVEPSAFFNPVNVKSVFAEDDEFVYFFHPGNVVRYNIMTAAQSEVFSQNLLSGSTLTAACVGGGWVCAASEKYLFVKDGEGAESRLELPEPGEVTALLRMSDGTVYIGTLSSGLWKCSRGGVGAIDRVLDIGSKVNNIMEDSCGRLWVCTRSNGLVRIDPDGATVRYSHDPRDPGSLLDNYVRCICEDGNGRLWIGSMFGIDCLEPSTGVFTHFGKSSVAYYGMRNLTVECMVKDRTGKIWCGSFYSGLMYFEPEERHFDVIPVADANDESVTILGDIVTDSRGDIWAGTSDKGLYHYDIGRGRGEFLRMRNSGIPGDNVKALLYDEAADKLWVGMFIGGVAVLDIGTGRWSRVDMSAPDCSSEDLEIVHNLCFGHDCVYAATYAGVIKIDRKTLKSELSIRLPRVFNVLLGKNGALYVVSGQNVFRLYRKDGKGEWIQAFRSTLRNDSFTVIREDASGIIWLGTTHGGAIRFDPSDVSRRIYDMESCGIPANLVSSIVPLSEDLVLLGTSAGLSLLKPSEAKSENFTKDTGFPLASMENGSLFRSKAGLIYGTGVDAVIRFDENSVAAPEVSPGISLSSLYINEQKVWPGDASGIMDAPLRYTDRLSLGYKARILDFNIATDVPGDFSLADFQYMLEGYDDGWKTLGSKTIRYMNLAPGRYELKLRSRPDKLYSNPSTASLPIRVHPPFYATIFACCIYALLIIGVISLIINYFYSKRQFRQTLEFERKDKERREKVNQWKLVFFTNISHEFRTPLTIILSHLDFLNDYHFEAPADNFIATIRRNAVKLRELVDELLDFRKQEQGHMSLKVRRGDLVPYLEGICEDFYSYAKLKDIDFAFETDNPLAELIFDPVQLKKVFYNLISNAFKHTEAGGRIRVKLSSSPGQTTVKVSDTGHGIEESKFNSIFDRFYHEGRDASDTGVGIGLALSKGIVVLHGGRISVESKLGTGSVFTVALDPHYDFSSAEHVSFISEAGGSEGPSAPVDIAPGATEIPVVQKTEAGQRPVMLIVEDDVELRQTLGYAFSADYTVHYAANGEEGLSQAKNIQPDIIISDIMMPKMSGTQMCKILKSDFETCHIPVILLTALSTTGQFVEGLESGADDYVSKPFDMPVLSARCATVIRNRNLLRNKYIGGDIPSPVPVPDDSGNINRLDSEFAASVMELIRSHIDDSELDVNLMCRELALSRTLLFVKIKGVFGKTPTGLVQHVRLEEAARLLREKPEMKIAEVADLVGINSQQYFGKIFRQHFGLTPSEYRSKRS